MTLRKTGQCPQGHCLEQKNYQKQYMCDGCREQGHGPRYRCELCNYDLHESCMKTTDPAHHPFFKEETLIFLKEVPEDLGRRRCDACTQEICGFVYQSRHENVKERRDLHPCCLDLNRKLKAIDIDYELIQEGAKSNCMWCNEKTLKGSVPTVRGWSYQSTCKKHQIHVYCVMESALDVLKRRGTVKVEDVLGRLRKKQTKEKNSAFILKMLVEISKIGASILLGDPTLTF